MRNIPTQLVMLEIAEGLKALIADKDLSKSIAEAYALSEEEQKKAEDAKAIIASADALMANIKKKEESLAIVDERIKKAEKLEKANTEALKSINKERVVLNAQAVANKTEAEANKKEAERLSGVSADLDARAEAVTKGEAELAEAKADFKRRTDAMKELAA